MHTAVAVYHSFDEGFFFPIYAATLQLSAVIVVGKEGNGTQST
jgi:hypothetical protein